MKIAITADPFLPVPPTNYGGIERIIHFLVEGLKVRGHEVLLVAHRHSNVSSTLIPYATEQPGFYNHLKNIRTINQIKAFDPEIIHSFSRLGYLLPFFQSKIPKLMSYQREPTIPQIRKAVKLCKKDTMHFSGCSNYITNKITPYAPASTVYNGIELNKYDFIPSTPNDSPLVFLGRIEPIKGTHLAMSAAIQTDRKLIIAGNVPKEHEGYFNNQIKPFLSDKIKYVGPVNDIQKNKILGSAAALLMPIEWEEPFGIVMAEALACGTPVIGYARGAVPEVIEHGRNGFIVNDMETLCQYISKVQELDRTQARSVAEEKFSSDVIIDNYLGLYKSLINK